MGASAEMELLVGSRARGSRAHGAPEEDGEVTTLLSPGVGLFTAARAKGDLLAPGTHAGVLLVLGKAFDLVVPRGVEGRVRTVPPARTRQPVGWGDALYELEPMAAGVGGAGTSGSTAVSSPGPAPPSQDPGGPAKLLVLSPQSGRFHLRPGPGEEAFAPVGAVVERGQPIGLIEVMKTFAHVRYGDEGLPAHARIVRVLIEDGAEIGVGDPLFEVAPISEN